MKIADDSPKTIDKDDDDLPLAPPSKKSDRHKKVVVADGPKIIMDMSWGNLMDEHLQKKVIQQSSYAYSINKKAEKSLPLIFTSVDLNWRQLLHRVNAFQWNKNMVRFEKESFVNIEDIPLSDVVYLTADTENVCTFLDPKKYYVIGCLLDHNSKKGVTHDFAVQHNIRMERLPIPEYIKMEGRHVLTINHVAEILVRVGNGEDWGDAFVNTIPARKNPTKINQNVRKIENPKEKSEKKEEEKLGFWCNIA
ncbi:tRNA (guanine(9)-N1)-methyltransferase [Tritrichomonas foetus]|uniref:tRNA (guanine(9)-N(1))-methyltransferase n=1 Tax=Tritrichomonas foetus TaxID=1144522 RepID=A0A1J4JB60_9EUKA|nr:tRNA (guanine(9)-N1)-methyltransferase [Tritrichomonas foetus]|eukprot:OHS95471.1 tRNA (guanine(9)-N1)-methyltransferase [Tritrichomonas foetus]